MHQATLHMARDAADGHWCAGGVGEYTAHAHTALTALAQQLYTSWMKVGPPAALCSSRGLRLSYLFIGRSQIGLELED